MAARLDLRQPICADPPTRPGHPSLAIEDYALVQRPGEDRLDDVGRKQRETAIRLTSLEFNFSAAAIIASGGCHAIISGVSIAEAMCSCSSGLSLRSFAGQFLIAEHLDRRKVRAERCTRSHFPYLLLLLRGGFFRPFYQS